MAQRKTVWQSTKKAETMNEDLPDNNEGWFKRHVIDTLSELRQGQRDLVLNQKEMHKENQRILEDLSETITTHEEADQHMFSSIQTELGGVKRDLSGLEPVKKLVYSAIGIVLLAFMAALVAMVIKK